MGHIKEVMIGSGNDSLHRRHQDIIWIADTKSTYFAPSFFQFSFIMEYGNISYLIQWRPFIARFIVANIL